MQEVVHVGACNAGEGGYESDVTAVAVHACADTMAGRAALPCAPGGIGGGMGGQSLPTGRPVGTDMTVGGSNSWKL